MLFVQILVKRKPNLLPTHSQPSEAERVHHIRRRIAERKQKMVVWTGDPRIMRQSLENSKHISALQLRRGRLTRDLLAQMPLEIDDDELLAGRLAADSETWRQEREVASKLLNQNYPNIFPPGITGHCELDYSRLFQIGIGGLQQEIGHLESCTSGEKQRTYQSFRLALEGFSHLALNAAQVATAARKHAAPARQAELTEIIDSCTRISKHPPHTFRDALQLLWFTILGTGFGEHATLVSPGHLDRTLRRFYEADLTAQRLTREDALALLEALYLLINDYIPDSLAISVMVGGRDADGNDVTNDLSYLCLEALWRTKLVYPTVGVCWHAGTPENLTRLVVELIAAGYPNPAFFGDETIQRGLREYGVQTAEACAYLNSTCVEITPCGASNVWVASPYIPLAKILLDEIENQVRTGTVAENYEAFWQAYCGRLARHIAEAVAQENASRRARQQFGGKPLQSVLTRDCIARGRDIDNGGARYNWVECSFVGIANLVDSFYVVQQIVFKEKRRSLTELYQLLATNFEHNEAERIRFLNAYPKYGNGNPAVDERVTELVEFVKIECARHKIYPDDSHFIPGAFCWIMHEYLGRECGATPDGRLAGFPFADGCGGAQGREMRGPTAAIASVTSWNAAPLIGGAAFNMKFNANLFKSPESVHRLRDLILTFLKRGGFEIQVNVLQPDTLQQAIKNPEAFADLVVRIGGYTDYFTRLSPQMQQELLLRSFYEGF
jgi:formate C-acetyltransferase